LTLTEKGGGTKRASKKSSCVQREARPGFCQEKGGGVYHWGNELHKQPLHKKKKNTGERKIPVRTGQDTEDSRGVKGDGGGKNPTDIRKRSVGGPCCKHCIKE